MNQPEPTSRVSLSEEKIRRVVAEATDKFATKDELDDAIAAVRQDIRITESRLRKEWTDTVRYEIGRVENHLGEQDHSIRGIYLAAISSLVLLVCAVIGLIGYFALR